MVPLVVQSGHKHQSYDLALALDYSFSSVTPLLVLLHQLASK